MTSGGFSQFSDLPREVRNMIWKEYFRDFFGVKRIHMITLSDIPAIETLGFRAKTLNAPDRTPSRPSVALANREAAEEYKLFRQMKAQLFSHWQVVDMNYDIKNDRYVSYSFADWSVCFIQMVTTDWRGYTAQPIGPSRATIRAELELEPGPHLSRARAGPSGVNWEQDIIFLASEALGPSLWGFHLKDWANKVQHLAIRVPSFDMRSYWPYQRPPGWPDYNTTRNRDEMIQFLQRSFPSLVTLKCVYLLQDSLEDRRRSYEAATWGWDEVDVLPLDVDKERYPRDEHGLLPVASYQAAVGAIGMDTFFCRKSDFVLQKPAEPAFPPLRVLWSSTSTVSTGFSCLGMSGIGSIRRPD
ncbi:hypothetical protein F5Y17DRAFT_472167 [Xylariaceae sp. FL0594]|nr:hypothetical protein F5Y17DRAFT_472167 [Xylariaceae sp. FL0594]